MSEKLDLYLPTMENLAGVRRQLVNAGITPESIPEDWLVAIVSATRKWISESQTGAQDAIGLLGFEWFGGDPSCHYAIQGHLNTKDIEVKPENITFFRGAMVQNEAISLSTLKISKRDTNSCDSCGILSHCTSVIREPRTDRLETLCNFCISNHESFSVRDQGGTDICGRCTKIACSHHPSKDHTWDERKFA